MSLRFVLLGHPVAHSLSPAIHQAAYDELALPHRYELCDAPDETVVREVVDAIRAGTVAGSNVTVPWKKTALALADRADQSAAGVGAANTLARAADGAVVAHNTDVRALAAELAELVAAPERTLVLGAGGAALAAVAAASLAGAREIGVTARRFSAALPIAEWPGATALARLGAELLPWPAPDEADGAVARFGAGAKLVVQATSAGMHGAEPGDALARLVPWGALAAGAGAYDLVYNPAETAFLRAARAAGVAARGGLGMLVEQAALAFEIWLGVPAPRGAMQRAAVAALAARNG